MAIVQSMKPVPSKTFDAIADHYQHQFVQGFHKADILIDVFDRYDNEAAERTR